MAPEPLRARGIAASAALESPQETHSRAERAARNRIAGRVQWSRKGISTRAQAKCGNQTEEGENTDGAIPRNLSPAMGGEHPAGIAIAAPNHQREKRNAIEEWRITLENDADDKVSA